MKYQGPPLPRQILLAAAVVLFSLMAWSQSDNVASAPSASGESSATAALDKPEFRVGERLSVPGKTSAKPGKYDITRIGNRGIGGGLNFYSFEKERALGKELASEVEQQSKLVHDPVVEEYVNRVGQNIVRNSDAKVPFTIKIIDNDEVNAFALPGGFFYVNTGLIFAADNESELAGVMAHEIAHVAARHATKNATKGDIWNLASIPLIFVGGPIGYAVQQAAGLAVPMSVLKFSRDAEREADLLGIQYEYASGYDPASFVQFFEKIKSTEKKKPGFLSKAFSSHPMTDDRIRRAQQEIQTMLPAKDQYMVDSSEFQDMKARLAAVVNRSKSFDPAQAGRPTLHRPGGNGGGSEGSSDGRPTLHRQDTGSDSSTTSDPSRSDPAATENPTTDDDRPTLKRNDP